jgi:hypothetical protein
MRCNEISKALRRIQDLVLSRKALLGEKREPLSIQLKKIRKSEVKMPHRRRVASEAGRAARIRDRVTHSQKKTGGISGGPQKESDDFIRAFGRKEQLVKHLRHASCLSMQI